MPAIPPSKFVYGQNLAMILKKNKVLPGLDDLVVKHSCGDCGNAWPEEDFVLLQLRHHLGGLPYESRWQTDIGVLVLCTFFNGDVIAAELLPYPKTESVST